MIDESFIFFSSVTVQKTFIIMASYESAMESSLLGGKGETLPAGPGLLVQKPIKPCACDSSLRYVHRNCLNQLRAESRTRLLLHVAQFVDRIIGLLEKGNTRRRTKQSGSLAEKGKESCSGISSKIPYLQ